VSARIDLLNLLVWIAVAISQTKPTPALPEPVRTHVRNERFDVVSSIRGLPLGVREELQEMWGGALDIAEPGGDFQRGATANPALPARRLVAAGCALDQHCLVYYERGGNDHTWVVVLFHWTPAATKLEFGGRAPARLKTIDEVRKAVLSGAIDPNVVW
jgi:hypothetical protein